MSEYDITFPLSESSITFLQNNLLSQIFKEDIRSKNEEKLLTEESESSEEEDEEEDTKIGYYKLCKKKRRKIENILRSLDSSRHK